MKSFIQITFIQAMEMIQEGKENELFTTYQYKDMQPIEEMGTVAIVDLPGYQYYVLEEE